MSILSKGLQQLYRNITYAMSIIGSARSLTVNEVITLAFAICVLQYMGSIGRGTDGH